ncbi:hypothetical protein FJV41_34360 [Myxococcus llanfairpwllgwyngyllgogerychwyrndrobwllllantysiliogogogochensis]|uniref:Uncharacterized protein n=1 Tax=Myxococcus llanfairpwllgwyngyllgogerychwyrndrobwllllantysiliogogogochensis TaxID=2590453 RepID=A0A540WQY8_9BACT|nr:hypothetical protein [Myxococcus llanfairpwllgwyngyllgogerychwyrndrobwllllantysiliogogogochensis]TQF11418.1 hypothetical protein FJV41_34360 [Myxococcus llanfairpwllgwyngyllgogerychwyrndrobwllllantysiliogogogochensis]
MALQFNPYLIAKGYSQVYQQYVNARVRMADRILQDTAVTLVAVPGTPFEGVEYESGRFGTIGAGVSAELLGERSIYGPVYSQCLNAATTSPSVSGAMSVRPEPLEPKKADESEESWRARSELTLQRNEEANRQILRTVENEMERCAKKARETTNALFLSLGGRWVTPGLNMQQGDGIAIQRGFAALSYALLSTSDIELALQGRALYDRPAPGSRMEKWLDGGVSLGLAGRMGTLRLECVRSLERLGNTDRNRASYALTARIRLTDEWAVGVNALGEGSTLRRAIDMTKLGLAITYADTPVFRKDYSRPPWP